MAINWFPGHMNKARREIRKAMPKVDFIIEVLDARLPFSSENPLVNQLRGDKPLIKVLNKRDLADPHVTRAWRDHFQRLPGVTAITLQRDQPNEAKRLPSMGRALLPADRSAHRPVTAMIVGVPNVGKSTLINLLLGRTVAKASNKPAVTKRHQRVELARDFILLDTPGFLWPKLYPADCGYRLAVCGSVAPTAFDFEDIGVWGARFLMAEYPGRLAERYKLKSLPDTPLELLEEIARRRGCLGKGAVVQMQKVSELLIREIRGGQLGRLSFERPPVAEPQVAEPKAVQEPSDEPSAPAVAEAASPAESDSVKTPAEE